jgi:hypothetical protein
MIAFSICAVFSAALGLGYYAVNKMNPGAFRVRTCMWRVFSFDIEISSASTIEKSEAKVIPPVRSEAA